MEAVKISDGDKEYQNVFTIPPNYTDSGKLFGGMTETRNTIEAAILLLLVGYPELMWLHISLTTKVVVMTVTLLPLGVFGVMGVGGDSLFQFAAHITAFFVRRRILHFRRVGYRYDGGKAKQGRKTGQKRGGREENRKDGKRGSRPQSPKKRRGS